MIYENDGLSTGVDEISAELVRGLPIELTEAPDKPWTKAIKDRLIEMGKQRSMMVCCHGSQDQGGGFSTSFGWLRKNTRLSWRWNRSGGT